MTIRPFFYFSWYLNNTFCEITLAIHKNIGQDNSIAIIIGLSDNISINWDIVYFLEINF